MEAADLIGLAGGAVGITLAAWIARIRHVADLPHASRLGRMFFAALAFALVQHLQYTAWVYWRAGGADQLAANFWPTLFVMAFASYLMLFPIELILGYFLPQRTRSWLGVAIATFAALGALFVAAPVWLGANQATLGPALLLPAVSGATAAVIWWAFLPPPPDGPPASVE